MLTNRRPVPYGCSGRCRRGPRCSRYDRVAEYLHEIVNAEDWTCEARMSRVSRRPDNRRRTIKTMRRWQRAHESQDRWRDRTRPILIPCAVRRPPSWGAVPISAVGRWGPSPFSPSITALSHVPLAEVAVPFAFGPHLPLALALPVAFTFALAIPRRAEWPLTFELRWCSLAVSSAFAILFGGRTQRTTTSAASRYIHLGRTRLESHRRGVVARERPRANAECHVARGDSVQRAVLVAIGEELDRGVHGVGSCSDAK